MSYMVAQRELFGVTHYSIQVNSVKLNVSIAICCWHELCELSNLLLQLICVANGNFSTDDVYWTE